MAEPEPVVEALEQPEVAAAVRAQRPAHPALGNRTHQFVEPRVERRLAAEKIERFDPGGPQAIEHQGKIGQFDVRRRGHPRKKQKSQARLQRSVG